MIQCATLGTPKGMKNAVSISVDFCLNFLIRNENITSKGIQNEKLFEVILHVGRVASLPSWVAKKSCHGHTLINECSISDYPSNFELIPLGVLKFSCCQEIKL